MTQNLRRLGAILAAVAWLAACIWALSRFGLENLSTILGLSVIFAVLAKILRTVNWRRKKPFNVAVLQDAVAILEMQSLERWSRQLRSRHLRALDSISTKWVSWQRPAHLGRAEQEVGVVGLAELVALFRASRLRRLAILGPRGSGKTSLAVEISHALLVERQRTQHGPVPVLFLLTTWNPDAQTFGDWLESQLLDEFPDLRATAVDFAKDVARYLFDSKRILPVLDGLDEMAPGHVSKALAGIREGMFRHDSYIITSHVAPYCEALADVGNFGAELEVEALPVSFEEGKRFLLSNTPRPGVAAAWQEVFAEVATGTRPQVAAALESPLFLALARSAYNKAHSQPRELLDVTRYPTAESIERHLLERLLDDLYPPAVGPQAAREAWPRQKAIRWLAFLAAHIRRTGVYAIGWWQIATAVPRPHRMWVGGLCGAASGVLVWLTPDFGRGLGVGFAGALVAATAWTASKLAIARVRRRRLRSVPSQPILWWNNGRGLMFTIAFAVMFGIITAALVSVATAAMEPLWALALDTVSGAVTGCLAGLLRWTDHKNIPGNERFSSASETLKIERRISIRNIGLLGIVALVLLASSTFYGAQLLGGLVLGLCVGAGAIALAHQPGQGEIGQVGSVAWMSFYISLFVLAVSGRFPWRLQRFLDDAAKREALRHKGSLYQFRHASLQDYLASEYESTRSASR